MELTAMRRIIAVLTLAALCVATGSAQKAASPEAQLGAIIKQAEVELDYAEAIPKYKKFIEENGKDAGLAAKALYHLGLAYEKVGSPEARPTFELVAKQFSTRTEAKAALARLGGAARGMNVSKIWSGDSRYSVISVSPDGRYFVGMDGSQPGLVLHDISSNTDRRLTTDIGASTINPFAVFTPDGKRIVYAAGFPEDGPAELRIVNLDGTGRRTIVKTTEYLMEPTAITPDGKTVAVTLGRRDNTWHVGLVSLDNGTITILRDNGWKDTYVGNFSQDGRWLTYFVQVSRNTVEGAVHTVATDATDEHVLIPANAVNRAPFFTPDGSRVVFRNGTLPNDLWSIPVAEGKPSGAPELAKSGAGPVMGFARDGSLYYSDSTYRQGVYVAEVDPATWKLKNAPKDISNLRPSGMSNPAWSPDGKVLAYAWRPPVTRSPGDVKIVLHSFDGAPDRELSTREDRSTLLGWSPDGKSLVITSDDKGMRFFDTETQREQLILKKDSGESELEEAFPFPKDGRAVFITTVDGRPKGTPVSSAIAGTLHLTRHDLQTGEERELYRGETRQRFPWPPALSPDGRSVVFGFLRPDAKTQSVFLTSVSGGESRELSTTEGVNGLAWTQDSKAVLFSKSGEIWVHPIDGSAAYSTGIRFSGLSTPSVHPEGTRIAFIASASNKHVWTIKNLFPETSAAKR
jgi:Tol biopolymer transport system component